MVTSLETNLWNFNWIFQEAVQQVTKTEVSCNPGKISFFRNFIGSYRLPDEIITKNQGCLHILLDLSMDYENEAFVLGFTMGNDSNIRNYHLHLFKLRSKFIYPKKYRFNKWQLELFSWGFHYGKSLPTKNLHSFNFEKFYPYRIGEIRAFLDIWLEEVQDYRQGLQRWAST